MTLTGIAAAAAASRSGIRRLLEGAEAIGGIYHLDFEHAVVLTNDDWKRHVSGVPRGSFLLATTIRPGDPVGDAEDDELILLRVEGVADLPNQSELVETRMDAMRALTEEEKTPNEVLDPYTQGQMQWSAFRCRVLGTFYDDSVGSKVFVEWGSDIDNLYSAARYFVYKPGIDALSFIASYPEQTADEFSRGEQPHRIRLGAIRYSSTRRRAKSAHATDISVQVRVEDFISMKTAVFGMTRAGKSNTMKIIATAVFEHSRRTNMPIGQLLFDPAGEYANFNQQDQTALRLLGDDWVRIYRFGADGSDPSVRPLQVNFYDDSQRAAAQGLIEASLSDNTANYVARFLAADLSEPDATDYPNEGDLIAARNHASRGRLVFYGLLAKAEFRTPPQWAGLRVSMAGALADRILADSPNAFTRLAGGFIKVTSRVGLRETMDWLVANGADPEVAKWGRGEAVQALKPAYDLSGGRAVLARVRELVEFHNPSSHRDHCLEIQEELEAGRIVIVDLSLGSERVTQALSERIVNFILARANHRFREGGEPCRIQIFVEEAHRLFDREGFNQRLTDPWVRLAKEAAKFRIGLIYATQEVSSVEERVLANTHNWIVAHLNSKREIRELANYYDFESFGEDIMRSEDRGFARVKTLSGNYIVPIQIDKFGHELIDRARAAAGLPPTPHRGPAPAAAQ